MVEIGQGIANDRISAGGVAKSSKKTFLKEGGNWVWCLRLFAANYNTLKIHTCIVFRMSVIDTYPFGFQVDRRRRTLPLDSSTYPI